MQSLRSGKHRVFVLVWLGQWVSVMGSSMTTFALGVWILQHTGSVTQFGLAYLLTQLPGILISPLAGALTDRWDRRWVMVLSDSVAALATLAMVLLLYFDRLQTWHIYPAMAMNSIAAAFQWPAYSAATTLMVPKNSLSRASGMVQMAQSAARIVSPFLAGLLLSRIRIEGVLLIDVVSFCFALLVLLTVRFPRPPKLPELVQRQSLWRDAVRGWTYIRQRGGLLALVIFFGLVNFSIGFAQVLVTPMVLSFASEQVLGAVLSIGGVGMLLGSVVMSVWGGPRRRILGVLGFALLHGVSHIMLGLSPSPTLIAISLFLLFFAMPFINGCSQAIWQTKVPPALQGRVFAIRRMIAWSTLPAAYLVSGPVADHLFEPMMAADGLLANSVGMVIGVGPGRGMGLLFVLLGFASLLIALISFAVPKMRRVEEDLPDMIDEEPELA